MIRCTEKHCINEAHYPLCGMLLCEKHFSEIVIESRKYGLIENE